MSYYIVIHPMTMLTRDARRPYRGTFSFFLSSDDTFKYENDTYTFRQHINYMFHFNLDFLKHFLMSWSWDSPSSTNIRHKRDALKSHKMKLWTVNQWLSCWEASLCLWNQMFLIDSKFVINLSITHGRKGSNGGIHRDFLHTKNGLSASLDK